MLLLLLLLLALIKTSQFTSAPRGDLVATVCRPITDSAGISEIWMTVAQPWLTRNYSGRFMRYIVKVF